MKNNTLGSAHKGKTWPQYSGENHPRWNPDKIWTTECSNCHITVTPHWQYDESDHRCLTCAAKLRYETNQNFKDNHNHPSGEDHPRWNPFKSRYNAYKSKVYWLTEKVYVKHKDRLNPRNYPRTLCGVEGGYQLDHKISIKKAYDLGWTPEQTSDIGNLQLLPWKENRDKW